MSSPADHDMLDAFADGELDPTEHPDTVARLRDDPESRAHVEGVTRMREALTNMWQSETAPEGALQRVRAGLREADSEASTGDDITSDTAPSLTPHPYGHVWSPRRVSILGLAACAALVTVSWQFWPEARQTQASVIAIPPRLVSSANSLHRRADDGTPVTGTNDRSAVRMALSAELGLDVFAPDLTAHGYQFRRGQTCVVEEVPGAHLLYEQEDSRTLLSVFSIPRMERLRTGPLSPGVRHVFASEDDGLNTVAWHDRGQTHLVTATLIRSDILAMLDLVELAFQAPDCDILGDELVRFAEGGVSDYDAPIRDDSRLLSESTLQAKVRRVSRRGRNTSGWIGSIWQTIVMGRS